MAVIEGGDESYDKIEHVGLAIMTTELGFHTGLLYRSEDKLLRLLHLAFHHRLTDELAPTGYKWAQLGLDEDNKLILRYFLERLVQTAPLIPYAFDDTGLALDEETGELLNYEPGRGFTCATFIAAVLRNRGFEVVDIASWPEREEDASFHEKILIYLEKCADAEHVELVRESVGAKRLRPEELVGAGSLPMDDWAVEFGLAFERGTEVISELAA